MRIAPLAAALLSLVLTLTGCEGDAPQKPPPQAAAATQPTAEQIANMRDAFAGREPAGGGDLPAGHPPVAGGDKSGMGMGMNPPRDPAALNLKYDAPPTWKKETPSSVMRVDQYRLPTAGGDKEDGELGIFNQSIGGGVQANIDRWRSQFATSEGKPIPDEAFIQEKLEGGGMKVTFVDIAGRYSGAAMMGGTADKEGQRLLGAIVETPDGPWYFKATGPAATMAAHRDDFRKFIQTARHAKPDGKPADANSPAKTGDAKTPPTPPVPPSTKPESPTTQPGH
jgi:hypothetical protein